jgi:hypothetical protein
MSAGKGDKPRPVDHKKYDHNYDRTFRNKKTVGEWVALFEDEILDYDGFREYNLDDLIDEKTYKKGLQQCTTRLKG